MLVVKGNIYRDVSEQEAQRLLGMGYILCVKTPTVPDTGTNKKGGAKRGGNNSK